MLADRLLYHRWGGRGQRTEGKNAGGSTFLHHSFLIGSHLMFSPAKRSRPLTPWSLPRTLRGRASPPSRERGLFSRPFDPFIRAHALPPRQDGSAIFTKPRPMGHRSFFIRSYPVISPYRHAVRGCSITKACTRDYLDGPSHFHHSHQP